MQPGEFRIVHNADFDWGQRGYDDELRFAAGLTEDERAETGTPARWSARDVIAHNAAWKQRAATILSCAARGETPPAFDDEDRLNAETFESNRERPWPLVLADAEQALADLRAAVLALDEPQWTDPGRFPWRKGRPLWLLAYGNAYSHPQWHLGLWQLARRGVAGATQVHERLADTQRRLDDSPQSRATATYNLACFYSLSGQRDQAGWSVQDHLDHLAVWEKSAALLLERRPRDERFAAMGVDVATVQNSSEDELNATLRARTPPRTPAQSRAALRAAHDHLVRALGPLTDADLQRSYSHYQPEVGQDSGRPIMQWAASNSSLHYCEHLSWIEAIVAQS